MLRLSLPIFFFPLLAFSAAENFTLAIPGVTPRGCDIDVRVQGKPGPRGDVLFFPGFADCKDNHDALFGAWEAKGYRVVSFNYPEHGMEPKCRGMVFDTLTMKHIRTIARQVEAKVRASAPGGNAGPLTLAGWSTGGLLAAKAEKEDWFERKPQAMVLFAPAISVDLNPFKNREVQLDTLAPGARLKCPIQPKAPETIGLGGEIAKSSVFKDYNPRVPTISILASDKDDYIDAPKVKEWMRRQSNVHGYQCLLAGAAGNDTPYHGPDLTPGIAEHAIALSADFLGKLGSGNASLGKIRGRGPCAKLGGPQDARDSGGAGSEGEEGTAPAR